jgi:hypothetical protein
MTIVQWSYDETTRVIEGVRGSDFACCLVLSYPEYAWRFAHVTVGDHMRTIFSRPTRMGTSEELQELIEDELARPRDADDDG